ncbi:MAG: hypothetical protein N4P87_01810 [Candidatus Lightella neohaematopini]|nr:hypothetical protein [Candidatus Lightella neohaematopini]
MEKLSDITYDNSNITASTSSSSFNNYGIIIYYVLLRHYLELLIVK